MVKCHWLSPYDPASPPNIGKAINDAIEALKTGHDDWIILTDYDILWLLPDSKKHLMQVLAETDYDVLGVMTNRIRSKEQLVNEIFCEVDSIEWHMGRAKAAWETWGKDIKPAQGVIAAFCMCFSVGTWKRLGGFPEASITFDSVFSHRARRMGMKLGICEGIYIYHNYRSWSKNPYTDIAHLL